VGSTRGLPSASGGNNTIQGTLFFPYAKTDKHIKVRLTSTDSFDQTTSTNEDGTFIFNRLPAGHYTVIVDGGNEFDTATESVSIDREASAGGRIQNISINLKTKGTAAAYSKIPKPARENYTKGMEAVKAGDSKKAVELFKQAVDAYPQFGPALSELGAQYLKIGEVDKAIESLRAALKIDPKDLSAALNLGVALLNKKDFAAAEVQLRDVVQKDDKSATAHMYLGVTLASLKQTDEAEKELLVAIGLPGGDKLALAHKYLGGIYWKKGQKQQAADELEKYVTLAPKAPDAERIRDTIKNLRANP
jgi:Flp pilus assembly protein TadD